MTICIGALCEDGKAAVVAGDRMLTNAALSTEFEHPERKITPLAEGCVALSAGSALAHTELLREVVAAVSGQKSPSIAKVTEIVKGCYGKQREGQIADLFLRPRGFADLQQFYRAHKDLYPDVLCAIQSQVDAYDYNLEILVAGADNTGAHLYTIDNPGVSMCFDGIGYHAIGAGLPHAIDALIALDCRPQMMLAEMVCVVYQAKKRAERAPGVGAVTDMAIVREGHTTNLNTEQVARLEELCRNIRPVPIDFKPIEGILGVGSGDAKNVKREAAKSPGTSTD